MSLARRQFRLTHARVRSSTQRRGTTTKPFALSDRLTIFTDHLPTLRNAWRSLSPAYPPREALDDLGQHQRCAITVLNIGRMDHGMDQKSLGKTLLLLKSTPRSGNEKSRCACCVAATTRLLSRLRTGTHLVHPVAMSVSTIICTKLPEEDVPEWATKSTST